MVMIPLNASVHRIFPFLALGALLLLGGCSAAPLVVHVQGEGDMNEGNAARVRVYELSGDTNFQNTPLSSFWRGDEEALGSELVAAPREVLLYPDETKTVEFTANEQTQYVGVAADLRDPDREGWRSIHDIEEVKGDDFVVRVGANQIHISVE